MTYRHVRTLLVAMILAIGWLPWTHASSSAAQEATPDAAASSDTATPDLLWQSTGGPDAELYAAGSVVVAPDGNVWIDLPPVCS